MTDGNRDRGMMERVGRAMGGAAGRAADTAARMTGPLLQATANVLGGWWSGDEARQAAQSWDEERDRRCRRHFEQTAQAGGTARSYEQARPLYQLGHTAARNPEYQGRRFEEVEPDLRRVWAEGRMAGEADAGEGGGQGRQDVRAEGHPLEQAQQGDRAEGRQGDRGDRTEQGERGEGGDNGERGESGGRFQAEGSIGSDREDWPDARAFIEFGYGEGR